MTKHCRVIRWTFAFWTETEQTSDSAPDHCFTLLEKTADDDEAYAKAINLLGIQAEDQQPGVFMGDGGPYKD